jgi:hypothetical protein
MFNISFLNKNTIKNKKYFFILLSRTWFNAFLVLNRTNLVRTVESCSTVHGFSHHKKQQRAASCKPVVVPQLMVGPTSAKLQ